MIQKGKYPVEYIGITQYYSERHPALDIGWDTPNPPVLSALDGKVAVAATDTDGAKYIVIQHDNAITGKRVYTLYWHLSAFYVGKGNTVKRGDKIGVMGQTGNASGVHLHFEFWVCPEGYAWALKDKAKYAVDPQKYVYRFPDQKLSANANAVKGVRTYTGEDKPAPKPSGALSLKDEPLYAASDSKRRSGTVSGTYYRWDGEIVNGRMRITNKQENIGKAGQVTGWITAHTAYNAVHAVKDGDTLSGIAAMYGVSLDALIAANPQIKNPNLIYAGDKVAIP